MILWKIGEIFWKLKIVMQILVTTLTLASFLAMVNLHIQKFLMSKIFCINQYKL